MKRAAVYARTAAVYARVSTSDQSTGLQIKEAHDFIERRGWAHGSVFEDVGVSGGHDRRSGLQRLLQAAHRRNFDVLVVWRSDRLFRSVHHMAALIPNLHTQGIAFASVTEAFDTTTPAGALMLHVLSAFAQFERDVIVERTVAGMAEAKRRGTHIGRRRRHVDVDRARELVSAGASVRAVALELGIGYGTLQRALGAEGRDRDMKAKFITREEEDGIFLAELLSKDANFFLRGDDRAYALRLREKWGRIESLTPEESEWVCRKHVALYPHHGLVGGTRP